MSLVISLLLFPAVSFAEVYITSDEAIHRIFPSLEEYKTEKRVFNAQAVEISTIIKEGKIIGWAVKLDESGKNKPITFLAGIDSQGKALAVYVLEFRDIFGSEIKRRSFLKQFRDKSINDPLTVGRDIDAVTSATISSQAAATAVKKALRIIDDVKRIRLMRKIAIVGSPNVGKSVLFNGLTGSYAVVSNYPGTTVEVSRGKCKIGDEELEVVDTPGMYSLFSITEEERVGRSILLDEGPVVILHVIDTRNLERMLPLTLQLLEAGLGVILVLNIMDEAQKAGIRIDIARLEKELNIPVVGTVSTTGKGIDVLRGKIEEYVKNRAEK